MPLREDDVRRIGDCVKPWLRGLVDTRFGDLIGSMNSRFADVQASIEATQWIIGAGFMLLTAGIAVFQFLA